MYRAFHISFLHEKTIPYAQIIMKFIFQIVKEDLLFVTQSCVWIGDKSTKIILNKALLSILTDLFMFYE